MKKEHLNKFSINWKDNSWYIPLNASNYLEHHPRLSLLSFIHWFTHSIHPTTTMFIKVFVFLILQTKAKNEWIEMNKWMIFSGHQPASLSLHPSIHTSIQNTSSFLTFIEQHMFLFYFGSVCSLDLKILRSGKERTKPTNRQTNRPTDQFFFVGTMYKLLSFCHMDELYKFGHQADATKN